MKDQHKEEMFKILPWMYNIKCPCCNWTLIGNKKKNRRIVKKIARRRMKRELKELSNEG